MIWLKTQNLQLGLEDLLMLGNSVSYLVSIKT